MAAIVRREERERRPTLLKMCPGEPANEH